MNNYPFPMMPQNSNNSQRILEELTAIRETLKKIENHLEKEEQKKKNKYLEKDDNYYIV